MRNQMIFLVPVTLAMAFLLLVGCTGEAPPTPIVQTVVHTHQVEVTRDVEVTRIVEVTRQVLLTQVIEVPVTLTPSVPGSTATQEPQLQVTAAIAILTPQVTPQEKYTGFTPIFVHNRTGEKMNLFLAGPDEFNLTLWGGNQQKIWAREGNYSYQVWINGQDAYSGKFKIVSADKYDLFLDSDKAILWVP